MRSTEGKKCACSIKTEYAAGGYTFVQITYCPLHKAAQDLLEALKALRKRCDYSDLRDVADTAIAKAESKS